MTKPDDIPQDVWNVAGRIFEALRLHIFYETDFPSQDDTDSAALETAALDGEAIARAILAERNACAMRFLTYSDKSAEGDRPLEFQHISGAVAAIRTSR